MLADMSASGVNTLSGGVERTQAETYSPQRPTELDRGQVAKIEARPRMMAMKAGGGQVARMEAGPRASLAGLIHEVENALAVWIQNYQEKLSLEGGQEVGTVMASGHPPLAASFIGLWWRILLTHE